PARPAGGAGERPPPPADPSGTPATRGWTHTRRSTGAPGRVKRAAGHGRRRIGRHRRAGRPRIVIYNSFGFLQAPLPGGEANLGRDAPRTRGRRGARTRLWISSRLVARGLQGVNGARSGRAP